MLTRIAPEKGARAACAALLDRARSLSAAGRHAEAVPFLERHAAMMPGDLEATAALGWTLVAGGRAAEAIRVLARAEARYPGNSRLTHLTGHALLALDRPELALGAFYTALEAEPMGAAIHGSLAVALGLVGKEAEAVRHARLAFGIAPSAESAATLSCALINAGLLRDALAVSEAYPGTGCAELLVNRSIALDGLGRGEEAIRVARTVWQAHPAHATAEHHLAALLLGHGRLGPEAWRRYEGRLRLKGAREWPSAPPRWKGGCVAGKTVLLHAEQGLGDTIQFVRYAPLVQALGATVVLVVQPALKRLLAGFTGVSALLAVGEALPRIDTFAPLLSLPGLFQTTLETIPPVVPFAGAGEAASAVAGRGQGPLRVGLAWSGSTGFVEDRKRSIPAGAMRRVSGVAGAVFVSLQWPQGAMPPGVVDGMAGVMGFHDTAAVIAGLDLVVTVDTAVAHLAATMGKPVWLLSRFRGCWRWLAGRTDSPWYPSMTIYRQAQPNDWDEVLGRVAEDLVAWAGGGVRQPIAAGPPDRPA